MPTMRGALWQKCDSQANLRHHEKLNLSGFPLPYRKPLLFKRLNSFEFWIENLCRPNRWNFFQTDNSSCSNGSIFFWTDNPSHLNRYPSIYVFMWEIIIKKRLKIITVEDLIVYSRMNNMTVSKWCDRSTWPVSEVLGPSNYHFGPILSVDRLLFWALIHVHAITWQKHRTSANCRHTCNDGVSKGN